jgi:hypothetical protein
MNKPVPKPTPQTSKTIKVNLTEQIVEAFEGGARVFRFECVSGDKEHPTDRGVFRILRKSHPYRSRAYNVQMDHAMFFTQDGQGAAPVSRAHAFIDGAHGAQQCE